MEVELECLPKDKAQIEQLMADFQPKTQSGCEMWEVLKSELDIDKLIAVEVDHCPQSYACLLLSEKHGRLLYSGDTLPCQNLQNYGQDVKVLIHECTLQTGMEEDAFKKKHTTTKQAIEIGKKINAWRTILTHFSPRYQKVAEINETHIESKTLVAFDHMRISFSQLEWAYALLPIYQKMISNDDDEEGVQEGEESKQAGQKKQKAKKQKGSK